MSGVLMRAHPCTPRMHGKEQHFLPWIESKDETINNGAVHCQILQKIEIPVTVYGMTETKKVTLKMLERS